ncbi:MAG: ABC transporter ATP-binding protein [Planctomycetota bacterium]
MSNPTWRIGPPLLRTVGLKKSYYRGGEVPVLRGVDLEIRGGEFVSIVGSSGSGKTTLLHLLGTLDRPEEGEIYWQDQRVDNQSARFRDHFRNQVVGYVFQFYHLLPELTALENVLLPAMIRLSAIRYFPERRKLQRQAKELLARVGLSHRVHHKPSEMSGGEIQRTAIARALLADPKVLLADEPTGNLDIETGESIIQLLCELREEADLTILMVTHNLDLARRADRTLSLVQGRIEGSACAA